MKQESFEWDAEKDLVNQAKHGVSFADASMPSPIPIVSSRKTRPTASGRNGITASARLGAAS